MIELNSAFYVDRVFIECTIIGWIREEESLKIYIRRSESDYCIKFI